MRKNLNPRTTNLGKLQISQIFLVETEHTTTDPTGGDDSYAEEKYGGIF